MEVRFKIIEQFLRLSSKSIGRFKIDILSQVVILLFRFMPQTNFMSNDGIVQGKKEVGPYRVKIISNQIWVQMHIFFIGYIYIYDSLSFSLSKYVIKTF